MHKTLQWPHIHTNLMSWPWPLVKIHFFVTKIPQITVAYKIKAYLMLILYQNSAVRDVCSPVPWGSVGPAPWSSFSQPQGLTPSAPRRRDLQKKGWHHLSQGSCHLTPLPIAYWSEPCHMTTLVQGSLGGWPFPDGHVFSWNCPAPTNLAMSVTQSPSDS